MQLVGEHRRDRPCLRCVTDWCPSWCPFCPLLQSTSLRGSSSKNDFRFTVDLTPQHDWCNMCLLCEFLGTRGYPHTVVISDEEAAGSIAYAPFSTRCVNCLKANLFCSVSGASLLLLALFSSLASHEAASPDSHPLPLRPGWRCALHGTGNLSKRCDSFNHVALELLSHLPPPLSILSLMFEHILTPRGSPVRGASHRSVRVGVLPTSGLQPQQR
jgi:hypothetical protein